MALIIQEASQPSLICVEDSREEIHVAWKPPPPNSYKVNIDGSFRRGEGNSTCGGLIRDSKGSFVKGFHCNMGVCNAVWVELWALFLGIR